jgi:bifunctional DNA-binding transcriptional regulator/antitoxin component of YhaV-PrlF toxin-antitoxin module
MTPVTKKQARIASKGQITVPRDYRRALGDKPGDLMQFGSDNLGVRVLPVRDLGPFEKYRGIGNPGLSRGRKVILRWLREMRGE